MAIVLEKKERRVNWFALALGAAVLGSVGAGAYFLFFSSAPFIEVVAPIRFAETSSLSRITIDPGAVLNDAVYRTLKPYVADPTPGTLGRPNPFISF